MDGSSDPPRLDLAVLEALRGGLPPGALAPVLETFCASLAQSCNAIGSGLHARDRTGLGEAAHAIAGSAATFGATRLASAAGRLQSATASAGWTVVASAAGYLLAESAEVPPALRAWLDARSDSPG